MSMNSWNRAKNEVGACAEFSILARKLSLRMLSILGMSHQFSSAACRNVWREMIHLIMSQRIHRVAIIRGSINSSLSPLKINIRELVKFYQMPYGKKLRRQKVSPRKKFVTYFQIIVKLLLTKVAVKISSLAENYIKFCKIFNDKITLKNYFAKSK